MDFFGGSKKYTSLRWTWFFPPWWCRSSRPYSPVWSPPMPGGGTTMGETTSQQTPERYQHEDQCYDEWTYLASLKCHCKQELFHFPALAAWKTTQGIHDESLQATTQSVNHQIASCNTSSLQNHVKHESTSRSVCWVQTATTNNCKCFSNFD